MNVAMERSGEILGWTLLAVASQAGAGGGASCWCPGCISMEPGRRMREESRGAEQVLAPGQDLSLGPQGLVSGENRGGSRVH